MKKSVKVLMAVLVVLMALTLAGCGCEHEEVVTNAAVAPSCTQTGLTEGKHCAQCNHAIVAQEEIPATGHTEEVIPAVEASCTTAGATEGKKCVVCNEIIVKPDEIPATGHTEEVIPAVEASCTSAGATEGKKCKTCNEITVAPEEVKALGHTTNTGTCSRCGYNFGIFSIGYYVDEFKQPTSEGYVSNRTYIQGTFSNSATTNSKLYVTLLVDDENITIFLYEYGSHLVKNYSSRYSEEYDIVMKTADGKKHNLSGKIYTGGDRIVIDNSDESTVLKALKSGKNISFYIVQSDSPTSKYLFTVNTSNFAEKYAELIG